MKVVYRQKVLITGTQWLWPSTGRIPGGDVETPEVTRSRSIHASGMGDYSPQGIALVQSVLFPNYSPDYS